MDRVVLDLFASLARRCRDGTAFARHLPVRPLRIDGRPDGLRRRRACGASRPPRHGPLLGHERLRDVVVRPGFQAGDDIVAVRTGGDNDHGGVRGAADLPADLETVPSGQHQVQQDDVERPFTDPVQPLFTGGRFGDLQALALQRHLHRPSDTRIVLDDQDSARHAGRTAHFRPPRDTPPGPRGSADAMGERRHPSRRDPRPPALRSGDESGPGAARVTHRGTGPSVPSLAPDDEEFS